MDWLTLTLSVLALLGGISPYLVSNPNPKNRLLLTEFQNSFTVRLCSKFVIRSYLSIPPRLKHVATLPCEISIFKKIAMLKK